MSNINPQNIDGTFPIAGQDNNSQGFRDNFTNTVNNFTFASAELTDLQTYAILAAPLGSVGQTTTENNNTINYTIISEPQFKKAVETTKFIGNTGSGSSFEVDWSQGHFQTVGVTSTATMSFLSTWPTTNLHTKLRLQITSYGTTAITLPSEVSQNVNNIQGVSSNVLTVGSGIYQFEFTTADQGATIVIRDLLRNYDAPIDFSQLNVTGNVLSTGLSVFGNARVGLAGAISGQFHSVVGNITQTSSGGAVYINTTGNVLAASVTTGALVSNGNISAGLAGAVSGQFHTFVGNITQTTSGGAVYINTTGNVLATGLSVFGNATLGLAGVISGQFHSVVGNITQTSSGGAVYINTTGNVLAASVTTGALINNGNIIIADPIGAGSFGSNLTVKGTINYKTQDQANNFSVATTTKSLTLEPGGDQFLLLNITANCAIGYNATIVRGHQTTVHVKNSAGALAYVIVPNNNTTTGNAFIGLANGQVGTFVFTSYGTDAGNIMVTVTR